MPGLAHLTLASQESLSMVYEGKNNQDLFWFGFVFLSRCFVCLFVFGHLVRPGGEGWKGEFFGLDIFE